MTDKLIAMLISSIGLDPETTRAHIAALQNWIVNSIKNLDARMQAMETDRAIMHTKLDAILARLEHQEVQTKLLTNESEQSIDSTH